MNEKKFVFDWAHDEDTSVDYNSIYTDVHEAQLFGRGYSGLGLAFDRFARLSRRRAAPHRTRRARRVVYSSQCECVSDADWCLRSDIAPDPLGRFRHIAGTDVIAQKREKSKFYDVRQLRHHLDHGVARRAAGLRAARNLIPIRSDFEPGRGVLAIMVGEPPRGLLSAKSPFATIRIRTFPRLIRALRGTPTQNPDNPNPVGLNFEPARAV